MKYEIMDCLAARQATYAEDAPDTAMISITDFGDEKNHFYPQPWLKGVLELQFNDVLDGGYRCITETQAKEIAIFATSIYPKVERFIIHCEYGQSRSAGVAAALSDWFEGQSHGISGNIAYSPNWTCYRYVYDALRKYGNKRENHVIIKTMEELEAMAREQHTQRPGAAQPCTREKKP